jgi:thiol-disulfide isomerase/thioredoxin
LTILALSSALIVGCDYVEDPTPPGNNGGGNGGSGSEEITRKVLLEDITGHRCPNCPRAARRAQELKEETFGDDLILVAIHAGFFSNPVPPIGDGQYDTDNRTEAGNAYNLEYGASSYPIGLVSRKPYNGSILVNDGSWSSAVTDIIGQPAAFELWIDTIIVQGGNVTTEVKLRPLEDVQGDHNLVVYLLEDHVIDWQYDSESTPPDIPQYEHRHILRGNLNGTWGEPAIIGSASAGDTIPFSYTYALPSNVVDVNNCSLVAWIYNTATDEVMQAEERKFQP